MFLQSLSFPDWPVLNRELLRAGRKSWLHLFRYGFVAFLVLQLVVLLPSSRFVLPTNIEAMEAPSILDIRRQELAVWTVFWGRHALFLLQELFWWIVLITPAVSAGALAHEKEQGTLLALFCTQLRAGEILIGKLLGRVVFVFLPALAALPILVMAAISAEISLVRILLALTLLLVVMLAVAAAAMLAAVWTRRTSDAILACYASIIIVFIGSVVFLPNTPLPAWLDPGGLLEQIITGSGHWLLVFLGQISALGSVGALCLALAVWRLRPACLHQQERRSKRWLWAYRRPIGDDPVAWKERHVIGLAPFPWLHMVPTWMGLLGIFCFSSIVAGDAANFSTGTNLFRNLQAGNLIQAYRSLQGAMPDRVHTHLVIMGIVLVAGSAIIVAVRCGNSISEEKRRKTWEDLVLTPLTLAEIMAGKRRGILAAAIPAWFAYSLPMIALGALAGSGGLLHAAIWVVIGCFAMIAAGFVGIIMTDGNQGLSWDESAVLQQMIWQMISSATLIPKSKNWRPNAEWQLAVQFQALPVHSDAAGILLFRPDGQVIEVARSDGALAKPADSYRWLLARVSVARRYPELRRLLPLRPKHADNCQECKGSGLLHTLGSPGHSVCRSCSGLGWVYLPPRQSIPNIAPSESPVN